MGSLCLLCGSNHAKKLSFSHSDVNVVYDLHECSTCKAHFFTPLRNPGATWYQHDERYADRNRDPILMPNTKHQGVLAAFAKPGRVLDIGCGVGNFLVYAQSLGWEGWGIDFDEDGIAAGKRVFGLMHLEVADLNAFIAQHPNESFDLVTFFDVFEHIDNHAEFLDQVLRILSPRGSIALSTPYRHGWRWLLPHDLPPRHLTRWDRESLEIILKRHGFKLDRFIRVPASLYFIVMKLRFRYGGWTSIGLVIRSDISENRSHAKGGVTTKQTFVRALARTKDYVLFGLPAVILWTALLCSRRRYTDLYAIASRVD